MTFIEGNGKAYKEVMHNGNNQDEEFSTLNRNKSQTHEQIFMSILKNEIKYEKSLALKFMVFCLQFYHNYIWTMDDIFKEPLSSVIVEICIHEFTLKKRSIIGASDIEQERAMEFGNIVTEFCIRYLGYSLIKCQDEKIIVTARRDCDKRFEKYLLDGYSLQRLSEISWIPNLRHSIIIGWFESLPVRPTRLLDYPVDEIIETPNSQFVKLWEPYYGKNK